MRGGRREGLLNSRSFGGAILRREGSTQSIGHSQIALPFVGAVKKLGRGEEMFVQRVDTAILDVAEDIAAALKLLA